MDTNKLIQNKDEDIVDFLERALNEIVSNKKEYTLEFNDGIEIETKSYDIKDFNFDINTIIEDYKALKEKSNSSSFTSLIFQYLEFLEMSVNEEKQAQIQTISQNTEELNLRLITEKDSLERINKILKIESENQRKSITSYCENRIKSIDLITKNMQNELKIVKEQLELKKQALATAKDKLDKYNEELNDSREKENAANTYQLEIRVFMQKERVELYQSQVYDLEEQIKRLDFNLKEKIDEKKEIAEETIDKLQKLKDEVESKIGPLDKNSPESFIENSPVIKSIKAKIEKNEKKIHEFSQLVTLDNVKKIIENKGSTAELMEELNKIIAGIQDEKVENTIGIAISEEVRNTNIRQLEEEIENLQEKLNENSNYIDQEQYEEDQEKVKSLNEKLQDVEDKIKEITDQLNDYETLQKNKYDLKNCRKKIKKLEDLMSIEFDSDVYKKYEERVNELKEKEKELIETIDKLNSEITFKTSIGKSLLEKKLKKFKGKRFDIRREIRHIDEKTEEDYLDDEQQIKDETELNRLETKLTELKNQKIENKTITFGELITEISLQYQRTLNPNQNEELEEPVESYEEAPKGLLQKIKSKEFLKKARKAFVAIVTGVSIIAVGLVNHKKQSDDVVTKQTVEDNFDEVEEIEIDLEEPVIEDAKDTKSTIEEAQIDAIDKIRNEGSDGTIYKDVYSASNGENPYRVGQNTASYENATPGSMYALKDGERVKITVQDAIDYMEAGYEIVIAVENENQVIGFTPVELSENIEQQNGMSK